MNLVYEFEEFGFDLSLEQNFWGLWIFSWSSFGFGLSLFCNFEESSFEFGFGCA